MELKSLSTCAYALKCFPAISEKKKKKKKSPQKIYTCNFYVLQNRQILSKPRMNGVPVGEVLPAVCSHNQT